MDKTLSVCALVGVMWMSSAEAATTNVTAKTFGIDGMSCGDWMASPMQMRDGQAFVLGYWAASNRINVKHVGARSNTDDILGAVYKVCNAGTAATLVEAAAATYQRFENDGR
jgi:hypothetical protein